MRRTPASTVVDEHVANAVQVLDHRNGGFARDPLDQAPATARNDHIDEFVKRDQRADCGAIDSVDQLHRVFR